MIIVFLAALVVFVYLYSMQKLDNKQLKKGIETAIVGLEKAKTRQEIKQEIIYLKTFL